MADHVVVVRGYPVKKEPKLGQLWINKYGVVYSLMGIYRGERTNLYNAAVRLGSGGVTHNGWHLNIEDAVKGLTFLSDNAKITVEV